MATNIHYKPLAPIRYDWLDLLRGLAAMAVCGMHLRAVVLVERSAITSPKWWQEAFYFSTSLGHQAVIVFFVLSGFFVGGSVLKEKEKFSPVRYSIARLVRLWIVLIPALALTFLVDSMTRSIAPSALDGLFLNIWHSGLAPHTHTLGIEALLGNIFFLQTLVVPIYGSNTPLWSLANEFWYYALFPALLMASGQICNIRAKQLRWLSALVIAAFLFALPREFIPRFVVWLLGVLLWSFNQTRQPRASRLWAVAGFGVFFGALVLTKLEIASDRLPLNKEILLGVGFALFCRYLVVVPFPATRGAWLRLGTSNLAGFSYSLYLTHFPLVILVGGAVIGAHKLQPDYIGILVFLSILCGLVFVGYVTWALFERHTTHMRRWVETRILSSKNNR